ncbi:MAG: hypothetical protein F4029_03035 [Gammaproteobacteria bacterium]|nr:hypothetical protein [Gammaproteobacteria bacterium]MYF30699.1 hypothetical protein [Gammaproteobacteria bacterium]MYK45184.1 hypothetical protein [Gammaproteobacteria bacterium]
MNVVRYYTEEAVGELLGQIVDQKTWYLAPNTAYSSLQSRNPVRDTEIPSGQLANVLKTKGRKPERHDPSNALVVYRALANLTPHQASDIRLWTYLCHNECSTYVASRWLRGRSGSNENVARDIYNHFFVHGNRGLIRDNGISRLWWLGHIAHCVDPGQPERFLDVLLFRQDPRSALIERPSVSRNYRVLKSVYLVMKKDFETKERTLFVRETFREWMKGLNRQGGVVLLDALTDGRLDRLVKREADRAATQTG